MKKLIKKITIVLSCTFVVTCIIMTMSTLIYAMVGGHNTLIINLDSMGEQFIEFVIMLCLFGVFLTQIKKFAISLMEV